MKGINVNRLSAFVTNIFKNLGFRGSKDISMIVDPILHSVDLDSPVTFFLALTKVISGQSHSRGISDLLHVVKKEKKKRKKKRKNRNI